MLTAIAPQRPLTTANQATENRRHTRGITTKELLYFQRTVKVDKCPNKSDREMLVTDAILYFAREGNEVCSLEEGGRPLSYYLLIKARNINIDNGRASLAVKRGKGHQIISIDKPLLNSSDSMFIEIPSMAAAQDTEIDTQKIVSAVYAVLANYPDKMRLFDLHLQGFGTNEITLQMGWGEVDKAGRIDSKRARKALFDTQALLVKKLPALAAMRLGAGAKWAGDEDSKRETQYLSSADCHVLALKLDGNPISRSDRKKLKIAA